MAREKVPMFYFELDTSEEPTPKPSRGARPIVTDYNDHRRKSSTRAEVTDLVLGKYKCKENGVQPLTVTNGSTTPLVEHQDVDEELGDYDPFEHRKLERPTSDLDTLIHLLKGSLGSGILSMPLAFKNAGLYFGMVATFIIGFICTYCVHVLVKCAHELCRRTRVPSLDFSDVAEAAFMAGPDATKKFSRLAKATINTFLVVDLLGCCCVYIVFVAESLQQVVRDTTGTEISLQMYTLALLPLLLLLALVRDLKFLSPFSMVANLLIGGGIGICFYYMFTDIPSFDSVPKFSSLGKLPLFFGTAIFALEGIGVVMPLENNMRTPTHFIGCPGVLNIGMTVVVTLYTTVGFFGYLKYGEFTEPSITLNLGTDALAEAVKLMIAIAIFLTYGLQFYVPIQIIMRGLGDRVASHPVASEYALRIVLVIATVGTAAAVPKLGPFISLVGAVCLSTLGLMFPAIIEVVTFWDTPGGLGRYNWKIVKNFLVVCFGILGFATGTYCSIQDIIDSFEKPSS